MSLFWVRGTSDRNLILKHLCKWFRCSFKSLYAYLVRRFLNLRTFSSATWFLLVLHLFVASIVVVVTWWTFVLINNYFRPSECLPFLRFYWSVQLICRIIGFFNWDWCPLFKWRRSVLYLSRVCVGELSDIWGSKASLTSIFLWLRYSFVTVGVLFFETA